MDKGIAHQELSTENLSIIAQQTKYRPANYQPVSTEYNRCRCSAIAFNSQSNIMIAAYQEVIRVFDFHDGQLKDIQWLDGHTNLVAALQFFKQSNEFISGSDDNSIRIWAINNTQEWYGKQLLKDAHSYGVNCVIMNINQDLIISCGNDASIKFWTEKNEWECSQVLKNKGQIYQICLNDSQNQLSSCVQDWEEEKDHLILFQEGKNNIWWRKQTIQVQYYGRLCFVGDHIVTFQPLNIHVMTIFQLNQQTELFNARKEIEVYCFDKCYKYFHQQFCKQKQILLSKNGDKVFLTRKQGDFDFVINQTLEYGHEFVFGAMTDDGEYLVTWDALSRLLQVRQYQQ